nr:relaxase/mobilization nuclease domain-containing protein [Stagnihabitans tardus]
MDYLFSKSDGLFGNAVVLDAEGKGLSKEERAEIIGDWSEAWRGSPKNGHTTHLLLSFPADVRPDKAKLIAEVWAFEMFQSGEHQDDAWAYVAALHTDRPHPHVHMVINNRGLMRDSWFYMARDHVFNLDTMKERLVAIAAEEGVFLDATSRAERGLMSYGPSRGEVETARREGRAPEPRAKEGRALDAALVTFAQTAETMRGLAQVAALTGLTEVHDRIAETEQALAKGGILHRFQGSADAGRANLARHFEGWMAGAEDRIRKLGAPERNAMRKELYAHATEIALRLGDTRSAELLRMPPQTALYGTAIAGDRVMAGDTVTDLRPSARDVLRNDLVAAAASFGLSSDRIVERLETGAANAWEERAWVRSDLLVLSGRRRLGLRDPAQAKLVAGDLQQFYDKAGTLIDRSVSAELGAQTYRVVSTLRSMGRMMQLDGKVAFRSDRQAERFADDLRDRYGPTIIGDLAAGKIDALAQVIESPQERLLIAKAILAAGKAHQALRPTLQDQTETKQHLGFEAGGGKDWDRER